MENDHSCCHFQAGVDVCFEDDTTEPKRDCSDDCSGETVEEMAGQEKNYVMNMKCDMILLLLSNMIWTCIENKRMTRDFVYGENMVFGSLKEMTSMFWKNNELEAIIGGKHKFIC